MDRYKNRPKLLEHNSWWVKYNKISTTNNISTICSMVLKVKKNLTQKSKLKTKKIIFQFMRYRIFFSYTRKYVFLAVSTVKINRNWPLKDFVFIKTYNIKI